jgi:hypothetical protein
MRFTTGNFDQEFPRAGTLPPHRFRASTGTGREEGARRARLTDSQGGHEASCRAAALGRTPLGGVPPGTSEGRIVLRRRRRFPLLQAIFRDYAG